MLPSVVVVCDVTDLETLVREWRRSCRRRPRPSWCPARERRGTAARRAAPSTGTGGDIVSLLGDIIHPCTPCADSIVRPRHRREAGDGVETESGSSQPVKDERQVRIENILPPYKIFNVVPVQTVLNNSGQFGFQVSTTAAGGAVVTAAGEQQTPAETVIQNINNLSLAGEDSLGNRKNMSGHQKYFHPQDAAWRTSRPASARRPSPRARLTARARRSRSCRRRCSSTRSSWPSSSSCSSSTNSCSSR